MTDVETMVVGVLTGAEAQKLKAFTFMGKHFAPGTFGNIKNMIEAGFIKVVHEPKKGKVAEYDYGTNTMYVGFESAETLPQKALVAHEAVHAVYDMVKMKMSVADSESIAYIVQCTYARANAVDQNDRLRVKSDSSRDKVFEVAWGIAGKLLNGQQPSWDDCVAMREAVSEHPFYSAKFAKDAGFNG